MKLTCKDYKAAARKLLKAKKQGDYEKMKTAANKIEYLERCIRSDYFHELGVQDADYYLEQLNKEVRREMGMD